MNIRKTIIKTIVALTLVAVIAPVSTSALTIEELQAQINALMAQLSMLQGQTTTPTGAGAPAVCAGITFTRNMTTGATGTDVKCLQAILNQSPTTQVSTTGAGSPGNETSYFGGLTLAAVKKFQAENGMTPANQVGPMTRAKLNTMVSGGGVVVVPPPVVVPPTTAGGLTVALAYDTPTSATIADATNANFTKFTLTAGSGPVSITRLYVTRAGLSTNSDIENIKIVEADTGAYRGTTASLNADNRALITFTPALVIPANTTKAFYIRAGIVNDTAASKTVTLGITSNADITSNATAVSGAPAVGNAMTTVLLSVGTLTVTEDGTTVDSTPDAGDKDVIVNQFKLTAGSTEAVTVETITALKAGTADATDTNNIELWDVTHNKSLGTVASWDSEEKATFSNLNLVINKGESLRLKLMVDVVGGVESTAQTINADIEDGSDSLVIARGNTYGFYITSTNSGTGLGTNNQTINAGALNISKSSSTPATGNISAGDDVVLGAFDFDAKGEEVRITSLRVETTITGMTYDEVTNVRIFDENNNIVAGPMDLTDATPDYATFTDTIIVPVGVHKYTVKAKIADAVSTGDTIKVTINDPDSATGITAKGMTSGDSIVPTPGADVDANTLTVAAGDLDEVTLTTPILASVAKGFADYIWATASLSAANSGEDVLVSSISVLDTTSSAADGDDIDNMELWADLTSANSARGDAYETKISNTENPSGNDAGDNPTQAFTLTQTLTVAKGTFVKIALVADLNAGAAGVVDTDSHTFSFSAATATGSASGQDITEDVSGSGQAMTITTSGTLTVTADSSTPAANIIVAGQEVTLGVFRLAASNVENLDIDDLTFTVTGGASIASYTLYNGATAVGTASSGTSPKFTLADGSVTVPKNSYVRLTLKGMVQPKEYLTNNTTITAAINGTTLADSVNGTGLASGAEIDSNAQVASANGMDAYDTKPTFAVVSSRSGYILTGDLTPSASMLLAIYDVTANSSEDVTFEKAADIATDNTITFGISSVQGDGTSAQTWTLKDGNGTTLDTESVAYDATTVEFEFTDATFTVPAGETKSLFVYADTTEKEDNGDTIQVYLDDGTATNINWSINLDDGNYADADKIFRNDIYAGSFVNPS